MGLSNVPYAEKAVNRPTSNTCEPVSTDELNRMRVKLDELTELVDGNAYSVNQVNDLLYGTPVPETNANDPTSMPILIKIFNLLETSRVTREVLQGILKGL